MIDTCYCNANMDYCPVLLKIINKILVREYECDYLLQVWNFEGKMIYDKHLKSKDTSTLYFWSRLGKRLGNKQ